MKNSGVLQANWRRWAVLITLYELFRPVTTRELAAEIERGGWKVLPTHGRFDAVHRTCVSLSKETGFHNRAKVQRYATRPTKWSLTLRGSDYTFNFLVGSEEINPEKSREAMEAS